MRFKSLVVVAVGALSLAACSPTPFVEDNATRDRVLETYFTSEAAAVLRDVPLRVGALGENIAGLAVGDDFGSRSIAFVYGYPIEKQVVVVEGASDATILHEYVHQADYAGLISRSLFAERVADSTLDEPHQERVEGIRDEIVEAYTASFISTLALFYDDGLNREWLAFVAEAYTLEEPRWPRELVGVYQRVIRITDVEKVSLRRL